MSNKKVKTGTDGFESSNKKEKMKKTKSKSKNSIMKEIVNDMKFPKGEIRQNTINDDDNETEEQIKSLHSSADKIGTQEFSMEQQGPLSAAGKAEKERIEAEMAAEA